MTGEFLLNLLHASTNTHILHWKTKSYAEHMALGTFYEELPGLVDTLAEALFGEEEKIPSFPVDYYKPSETGLEELQSLKDYISENRHLVSEKSEISNLIDSIAGLIDQTIYKLKFLK